MLRSWLDARPRLKDGLSIAAIVVVWAFFFWRILTPNLADSLEFRHGDLTNQFLAMRQTTYSDFAQGRFPVIESCIYSGYPIQADPQAQLSYPPLLAMFGLGRVLGWPAYPFQALEWEVLGHALFAALGMFCLLRSLGLRRLASLFGSLVFGFGGFMTGYVLLQIALQFTAAWGPWLLAGLLRLARAPALRVRDVVFAAAPASLAFLGGNTQVFMYLAYVSTIAYLFWARAAGLGWRALLVRGALAGAVIVGFSAPGLLPQALFAAASTRASGSYPFLSAGFPLADLATFILPRITAVWWPLYVGVTAIVMSAVALRWRWRDARLWVFLAIAALVLSFGDHAAGFEAAYLTLPGYTQFRQQERHAVVISLAMSILSGYGLDAWLGAFGDRRRVWVKGVARLLTGLALAAFAALVAADVYTRLTPGIKDAGLVVEVVAMLALSLAGAAALWRWRAAVTVPATVLGILLASLLVFELATANRNNPEAVQPPGPVYEAMPVVRPALGPDAPYDPRLSRINNHFGLPLNGACVSGMSEIGGGSPIVYRDYATFLKRAPEEVIAKLLNVRYTVTWRGSVTTERGVKIPDRLLATEKYDGGDVRLFALDWEPRADMRAWVAPRVSVLAGPEQALERLQARDFDPFGEAVVSEPLSAMPGARGAAAVEGAARGYYKVRATADAPTLLVVSEAYQQNWKAIVNGVATPVVRVDTALIGVPIPSGASTVELSFRPDDLYAGLVVFAVTVLALLGWGTYRAIRARKERI